MQVKGRDYNPPKRDKILAWQAEQDFPIIPNSEDPDSGNVYQELRFRITSTTTLASITKKAEASQS
jgi:hypothetical protein